jgi:hypothetical protein
MYPAKYEFHCFPLQWSMALWLKFWPKNFFLWDWDLNSGLCAHKAGALPFETYLQSILLWLFWRWKQGGAGWP